MAAARRVHIVDVAMAPMAGLTSQPSMNALDRGAARLAARDRLDLKVMQPLATTGRRCASSTRPSSAA
jgi:pyruvate carboxylase